MSILLEKCNIAPPPVNGLYQNQVSNYFCQLLAETRSLMKIRDLVSEIELWQNLKKLPHHTVTFWECNGLCVYSCGLDVVGQMRLLWVLTLP